MPAFRIGTDDFKELISEGGYFVDKSLFIREIILGNKVTLIPRPRRFGKTLNMTMLRYFFEKNSEDRKDLFRDLAISEHAEFLAHQGQYPVIYITLKDVKGTTWYECRKRLSEKISELMLEFQYVEKTLPVFYRTGFEALATGVADDAILKASLKNLVTWLYDYHKKSAIILIDEYDTPMIEAWQNGYHDEMTTFMRSWLGAGLKHENGLALYRAVVTGILRIAKESIFSELNNLDVASPLMIGPFSDKFGFTQPEVDKILDDFNIPDKADIIRDWYNGYVFGGQTIYNPWSVTGYIRALPNTPAPKWLNTGSNALIYKELSTGGLTIQRDLKRLLSGKELRYPIREDIIFEDIGRDSENIWSFLFYSGYLRAEAPRASPLKKTETTYSISIPNLEISIVYEQFINRLFGQNNTVTGISEFLSFFLEDEQTKSLEQSLQNLVLSLVSFYDPGRLPEAVFHAFVLGLLANLRDIYEILSNHETGFGRADVIMRPKTHQYNQGYIIEFKTTGEKTDAHKAVMDALLQIDERKYGSGLLNAGVPRDKIRKLAIILQGKKVLVRAATD